MTEKRRIDQLLVERGLAESRARAQALVMAGLVFAGETRVDKPGQQIRDDVSLEVRGRDHPWVGRGGVKLAHAIEHFALNPRGAVAMDIGSSTGGFTEVLLANGAAHVFAVDVGTNQLAWKLRQDPRVTVLEQTNARALTPAQIDRGCDWVVCDASFIGLTKVLEMPLILAEPRCTLVALIKPQFEVGREEVGKGGIVRDPVLHARVCDEVREWLEEGGWRMLGITESPITGTEGNVEFLSGQYAGSGPDNPWFAALDKPAIYPPPAAFGIVWSVLYALMGFALALVCAAWGARYRLPAILAFLLQLALNLAWTPVFFAGHEITLALIVLGALDLAVLL